MTLQTSEGIADNAAKAAAELIGYCMHSNPDQKLAIGGSYRLFVDFKVVKDDVLGTHIKFKNLKIKPV